MSALLEPSVESLSGSQDPIELSIVMPCLNEAETVRSCVLEAAATLEAMMIRAEVIVADNGSTDGSQKIARECGARVVDVPDKGYGNALRSGVAAARGRYVIMGDADGSYDFSHIPRFVAAFRQGADLVMGNRFAGGIERNAMPVSHRYLGNPVLTRISQLFFRAPCGDICCGLRGFRKASYESLDLRSPGMEFAIEMVVKASLLGMNVSEVPTTLSPDGRSRPPHLRTWRDGWRHLRFLLLYSPRWLFLYPGMVLMLAGTVVSALLFADPRE